MFSTFIDVANFDIKIIRHEESGFYNLTYGFAQATQCDQATRISVEDWLQEKCCPILLREAQTRFGNIFVLANADGYQGMYVPPMIYRAMMMWLSPEYALEVFIHMDIIQEETNLLIDRADLDVSMTNLNMND